MDELRCSSCGRILPSAEFHKNSRYARGRSYQCKECKKKWSQSESGKKSKRRSRVKIYERYTSNEAGRSKLKKWAEDHRRRLGQTKRRKLPDSAVKAARKKVRSRSYQRNKEKENARTYLGKAIRAKIILRPSRCGKCFKECKPQGHHDDYAEPYDVEWLCVECHTKKHNGSRVYFKRTVNTFWKDFDKGEWVKA